nr:alpha-xylosidase [Bacteroidales bacterium]
HQADEWDYKGRNEELYQYNTKISVPFVVSSRRYGILWDSYSFCRWGDPRDYAQLDEVFTLYDKNGEKGYLTGTYTDAKGVQIIRNETSLAQEFLRTPQCDKVMNSIDDFSYQGAKVLYEGYLEPSQSGLFHFYIYYAGYTKVYVNGEAVTPEIWRTAWNPNGRKFEVELEAGVKAPLRIEWEPDGGVSYCALKALSPVDPSEQAKMSWWGQMQDQIDYYFIAAENIDGVISCYRKLTGKAPIMPKWALGYWQSRERYSSQEQVLSTLKEFRDRQIPIDNIVQDWQYWEDDQWGSHEFDASRYPDPADMVDQIHKMDARFMISVWPKFYVGTEHFNELDSKGWIYRTAVDEHVIDW